MTLRLIEGFENYGVTNQALSSTNNFTSRYGVTQGWDVDLDVGRYFGYSLRLGGNWATGTYDNISTPLLTSPTGQSPHPTFFVGFANKITNRWTTNTLLWAQLYGITTQFYIQVLQANAIYFQYNLNTPFHYRYAYAGDVILRRGSDNAIMFYWDRLMSDSEWHYYEFKMTAAADSTSFIECKKDGVVVPGYNFTGTSQNWGNMTGCPASTVNNLTGLLANSGLTGIDRFSFGNVGGYQSQTTWFDDIYICDDLGPYNNNYLGPIAVEALRPTGTGANSGWTPSTGAGWSCVDESIPNTTDYVSSTTTGTVDTYQFSIPSYLNNNVLAIQNNLYMRNNGSLNTGLIPVQRVGGTDYEAPSYLRVEGWKPDWADYKLIQETRPEDGASWTLSNITNPREFGLKTKS